MCYTRLSLPAVFAIDIYRQSSHMKSVWKSQALQRQTRLVHALISKSIPSNAIKCHQCVAKRDLKTDAHRRRRSVKKAMAWPVITYGRIARAGAFSLVTGRQVAVTFASAPNLKSKRPDLIIPTSGWTLGSPSTHQIIIHQHPLQHTLHYTTLPYHLPHPPTRNTVPPELIVRVQST